MAKKRAVVLLSGGIDSSTTLAFAKNEGYLVYAISFDYSQRHRRELESARTVATALGVKKHLIFEFNLRDIGGSALTSEINVPKTSINPPSSSIIPVTYVPARNTIFLSFALGWAEVLEAGDIFIGANAVDYSGYPDCRPEYLAAFETMANLATKISVEGRIRFRIHAPLISLKKSDIIRQGVTMGLDYSLTWSCYDPQKIRNTTPTTPPSRGEGKEGGESLAIGGYVPCGRCDSCLFRAKGFEEAGISDPLLTHDEK